MKHKELREEITWTTKEGVEILLKDMKDSHIRNCIRFVNRRKEELFAVVGTSSMERFNEYIENFKNELRYRRKNKLKRILSNEI